MDTLISDSIPFCVSCKQTTQFSAPPVVRQTRSGCRRRLSGRCARCGHMVSVFLSSETGPTVHSLKLGFRLKREIQLAATLLGLSQRAVAEKIVANYLQPFLREELSRMKTARLISEKEQAKRINQFDQAVREWRSGDSATERTQGSVGHIIRRLAGWLTRKPS
jgi:hypothetical protein